MPIYQGTGAGTSRTVAKVLRGTGANTYREIDHIYAGVSPTEYHEVFVRPALPTITSFAISPTNGTAGSLASTPNITASWTVAGVEETVPGTPGSPAPATLRAGATRLGEHIGWSSVTVGGSISPAPTNNVLEGIYWSTISNRFVVRLSRPVGLANTHFGTLTIGSASYNLITRNILPSTSILYAQGLNANPFRTGRTYSVQVTFLSQYTSGRLPTGQTAVFYSAGTPSTTRTVYPTISIAQTNADGSTLTHVVTAVPSGTQTIATPTQDATFRFDATNIEGTRSARARFDYRTALSNLSIVITGYRPQAGTAANIQEQPVVRFSWTGDPSSAYVLAPTASPARIDNVQNGSEHTFLVPFGEAARDLVFQLLCSGVDTNNASIGLTANRTIHVPARSG